MAKFKAIVAEKIDDLGIEILKEEMDVDVCIGISREDLLAKIDQYDALVVRSMTDVDEELMDKATNLKIVGRAGNGTDNINIPYATKKGIIIANTPDSNTISACELAIGLMLDGARDISYADKHLKNGNWDRIIFEGTELFGKTLGIIGLGRIGGYVATRMKAFGMDLIAYDPYISDERFAKYGAKKIDNLDELCKKADIITLHTPRTSETLKMISDREIALMKDGVRIVNAARGSLVDEEAAYKGIKSGKVASFGIDVHDKEPRTESPLYEFNNVTVTPHIGANTKDAQQNVGSMIAKQVINGLNGEIVSTAVNLPTINRDEFKSTKPYIELMESLGKIYYQLNKEKVKFVDINYWGTLATKDTQMIGIAFLKGLLTPVVDDSVNYINAKLLAEKASIGITENNNSEDYNNFSNIITVKITNVKGEEFSLAATVTNNGIGKLIEIDGYEVDVKPTSHMLYIKNNDVPGVIGHVGTLVGMDEVNVASMHVGRCDESKEAIMLLTIDKKVSRESTEKLNSIADILIAKSIEL